MSAPDTTAPAAADLPKEGMFAAYREAEHHMVWPWLLLIAGLVLAVVVAVRTARTTYYPVETRHGVAQLRTGMGASQVERYLGHPIAIESEGGLQCRRYGHLTFTQRFWIYSVCYDDSGQLVNVRAGQFEAKKIDNIPHLIPDPPGPAATPDTGAPAPASH